MAGNIDRAKKTRRDKEASGQDLQRKVFREQFHQDAALDGRSNRLARGKQPPLYNFSIYWANSLKAVRQLGDDIVRTQPTPGFLSNLTTRSSSRLGQETGHSTREAAAEQTNFSGSHAKARGQSSAMDNDSDSDDNFFAEYPFIGGTTSTAMRRRLVDGARGRDRQHRPRHEITRNAVMASDSSGMTLSFPRTRPEHCWWRWRTR